MVNFPDRITAFLYTPFWMLGRCIFPSIFRSWETMLKATKAEDFPVHYPFLDENDPFQNPLTDERTTQLNKNIEDRERKFQEKIAAIYPDSVQKNDEHVSAK